MCAQINKGDQEIERDRKRKCDMIETFWMDEITQVNMLTKVYLMTHLNVSPHLLHLVLLQDTQNSLESKTRLEMDLGIWNHSS